MAGHDDAPTHDAVDPAAPDSTVELLGRVKAGDRAAREILVSRYLLALKTWAHGRLPGFARDLHETDDLVQIALIRALDRMQGFEPRHPGAFLAYLRRIILNEIKDEIRRVRRMPGRVEFEEGWADATPSPVEKVSGVRKLEAYDAALSRLPVVYQEAIFMWVELGFTYEQVAKAIGSPSANAARMFVKRAVDRLAEVIDARG